MQRQLWWDKILVQNNWSGLNGGKFAGSATTTDVLAVYGRQLQVTCPLLLGYSRGADGIVVRPEVKRINHLAGRILTAAQFNESDFFIRYLAQEAGLGVNMLDSVDAEPVPEKINLVYCEDADVAGEVFLKCLETGRKNVAGCVTWAPTTTEVVEKSAGKARLLTTNRNLLIGSDVLLLNNANELDKVLPEDQRKAVEQWFASGKKGIVGLHAALVHQQKWPWLNALGGCDFNSDSDFLKATVWVEPTAKEHPAVKGQPEVFQIEADWTNHDRPVTGLPGFSVLLRVDESTYTPVREYFQTRGGKPMGKDHPIAWTNEPAAGGRFFYTEFGHDLRSLSTPFVRRHVLEGIKWAAAAKDASAK